MKDLKYYKDNCEEDYLHTPISVLRYITELEKIAETKPLIIDSVIPMLPNIESTEFCDWMTDNGYTNEQHGTMQKGDERYCINNLFKHYQNLLEFGN